VIIDGMLLISGNLLRKWRRRRGDFAYFMRTAQCAWMATTFSRYRARGKAFFVWTYSVRWENIHNPHAPHRAASESKTTWTPLLKVSVKLTSFSYLKSVGRTHLKITTIAACKASRVCPDIVVLIQCRGHVPLKPLDEVQEHHVTLLGTADELVGAVPVDGRF